MPILETFVAEYWPYLKHMINVIMEMPAAYFRKDYNSGERTVVCILFAFFESNRIFDSFDIKTMNCYLKYNKNESEIYQFVQ